MTPTHGRATTALLALALLITTATATAPSALARASTPSAGVAAAASAGVRVERGGPDARVAFTTGHRGEVYLRVAASARHVSWATPRAESAVVSLSVDGHDASDLVIPGPTPITREVGLGALPSGRHVLRVHYVGRSPAHAGAATLRGLRFDVVRPGSAEYAADRYAPVLFGRNVLDQGGAYPSYQGSYQNAETDTPLVAYHQFLPASTPGHRVIEYSVIWSNEDGGTSAPMLMAQWGRTTDIEWIYRVEVDARGRRVADSGVFQSPLHGTTRFQGEYDGTHPLLQTCTTNNNVCDTVDGRMRFALSTREVLSPRRTREHMMDRHPWTYRVMSQELLREGRVESPTSATTSALGDPRTYLFLAVNHATVPSSSTVGLSVEVTLRGSTTVYASNHGIAGGSVNRSGAQATTVELPVGATPADVATISLRRVPILPGAGAAVVAVAASRGFFLDPHYLPGRSFLDWHGQVTLTADSPTVEIYRAG